MTVQLKVKWYINGNEWWVQEKQNLSHSWYFYWDDWLRYPDVYQAIQNMSMSDVFWNVIEDADSYSIDSFFWFKIWYNSPDPEESWEAFNRERWWWVPEIFETWYWFADIEGSYIVWQVSMSLDANDECIPLLLKFDWENIDREILELVSINDTKLIPNITLAMDNQVISEIESLDEPRVDIYVLVR